MADENRDWIAKALFNAGTAAGAAALSVGAAPLGAAAIGVGALFANTVYDFACLRSQRRAQIFATELGGGDGADAMAALQAMRDDPAVQDVVLESARALAESISDCIVPALARLTSEYLSAGQRADGFFRGLRRMLMDLSEEEWTDLRRLIAQAVEDPFPEGAVAAQLAHDRASDVDYGFAMVGVVYVDSSDKTRTLRMNRKLGGFPTLLRVLHLLKTNDLARDAAFGNIAPALSAIMQITTLHRIANITK